MQGESVQFDAIFENGVLRPLGPVELPEHERLSVVVNQPSQGLSEVLDWDAHELAAREGDDRISLEEVQRALAKIHGSMAEAVSAQRDDRWLPIFWTPARW